MDQELRDMLHEIRQDIKSLLPVKQMTDRHELLLYGNGQPGILTTVESLKARHKAYDKVLGVLSTLVTLIFGDGLWRHIK